jgi:hypothetical protein
MSTRIVQLFRWKRSERLTRRTNLRLEILEERRNPVTASLVAGTLQIDGSPLPFANDWIKVYQDSGFIAVFDNRFRTNAVVPIQIAPGVFVNSVSEGSVTGIDVDGGVGHDIIDLNSLKAGFDPLTKPATLVGDLATTSSRAAKAMMKSGVTKGGYYLRKRRRRHH